MCIRILSHTRSRDTKKKASSIPIVPSHSPATQSIVCVASRWRKRHASSRGLTLHHRPSPQPRPRWYVHTCRSIPQHRQKSWQSQTTTQQGRQLRHVTISHQDTIDQPCTLTSYADILSPFKIDILCENQRLMITDSSRYLLLQSLTSATPNAF